MTSTMTYDALDRIKTKTYSGLTPVTPPVSYIYDDPAVPYSRGRLTKISNSVSVTEYAEFDALGRVLRSNRITDWHKFKMVYGYDHAGNLTTEQYPSSRTITYDRDDAGRLIGVNGTKSGENPAAYVAQGSYAPHGALAGAALGNGTWQHWNFNDRLQVTEIGVGSAAGNSSVWGLQYTYPQTQNNGNVTGERIVGPGIDIPRTYQYDRLNR